MKSILRGAVLAMFLTLGSVAFAETHTTSLGSHSDYAQVSMWESWVSASCTLRCNGEAMASFDSGGVTYAASGVSVSWTGGYGNMSATFSGLPEGEYTLETTIYAYGSFSDNDYGYVWWASGGQYSEVQFSW